MALRLEAQYLHHHLFGREPTQIVIEDYIRAHSGIPELSRFDQRQIRTMQTILEKSLDALAIEVWLRGKKTRHLLSCKLLLVSYLSESDACHPEYSRHSHNIRLGSLLITGCHTLFRLIRGRIQLVRYGLV